MKRNRLMALALGLVLLCSCAPTVPPVSAPAMPTPTPVPDPTPAPTSLTVNVAVPEGPGGLGAAKLMALAQEGGGEYDYRFTVFSDPDEAAKGLADGTIDIAALPTGLTSALYHELDGGVQLLALNTYGPLYILENGDTVGTMADLEGRTLHAWGEGVAEPVLRYLLEKNRVDPEAVDIRWYDSADEVSALMTSGEVCMLPVPAATEALTENESLRQALDLTEEWRKAKADGVLTMGCLAARRDFVSAQPQAVEDFLEEYEASVEHMSDPANLALSSDDNPVKLAERFGLLPEADLAVEAIPAAHLCFVTGDDMMDGVQGYYQTLYQVSPAAIGGSIPDGAFYYRGG